MVELSPEQRQAAQARGRHFVAATDEQVATLSMQRRVFWMEGRAFLAVRSDGFLETVATLRALLDEPSPPGMVAEPAPPPATAHGPGAAARSVAPPARRAVAGVVPELPSAAARPSPEALACTARLVASYVSTNRVAIGDLDGLIRGIHRSVTTLLAARQRS